MVIDSQTPSNWWGISDFDIQQSRQFQIGPLTINIVRLNGEWVISHDYMNDTEITDSTKVARSSEKNTLDSSRYVLADTSGQLSITPLLADRQIISRPITPFNLAAGEEVTLYISSPLWIDITVGESQRKKLKSLPSQRLSDTWFGPSTLEGELCYASNTHCRINLNELPYRPHRAITPVVIKNQADTTLFVERLNLPATLLHLYASADQQLWTPKVTLIREKDGDMASLKIDSEPPVEAQDAFKICESRENLSDGALYRAFNAIFN